MKLALYKNVMSSTVELIFEELDGEYLDDYVRISEFGDVDLPPLDNEKIVKEQVSKLREEKKRVQAETQMNLNIIDRKISRLLSLPEPRMVK